MGSIIITPRSIALEQVFGNDTLQFINSPSEVGPIIKSIRNNPTKAQQLRQKARHMILEGHGAIECCN